MCGLRYLLNFNFCTWLGVVFRGTWSLHFLDVFVVECNVLELLYVFICTTRRNIDNPTVEVVCKLAAIFFIIINNTTKFFSRVFGQYHYSKRTRFGRILSTLLVIIITIISCRITLLTRDCMLKHTFFRYYACLNLFSLLLRSYQHHHHRCCYISRVEMLVINAKPKSRGFLRYMLNSYKEPKS